MKNKVLVKFYDYFDYIRSDIRDSFEQYSSMVINENTFGNINSGYSSLDKILDRYRNNLYGALDFMHMMEYCSLDEYMIANNSIYEYFVKVRNELVDIEDDLFRRYINGDTETAAC